jgi:hypothetical protein
VLNVDMMVVRISERLLGVRNLSEAPDLMGNGYDDVADL